jgi:phenylpropionate dioxygenase-like ring-hydroxylating dioxygenase large terminal subunit
MPSADGAVGYPLETDVEKRAGRRWPEAGPSRIPNWVYTDPEIFAREQERIFAGPGWLYVCLDAEIANSGDFKRSRLGTREVVAARDHSGEVNVLVNRCAHRSAQLCSATRGTAKEFVCPYHQWTYDLVANCWACRSAAVIGARAACRPISARRSTDCSESR